jgi:hypothetical protein
MILEQIVLGVELAMDGKNKIPLKSLLLMLLIHFVFMYLLMYVMVNTFFDIYPSLEKMYMAILMTIPMFILEILFMGSMYRIKNKFFLIAISIFLFVLTFIFIRKQIFIKDKQFLNSMIPHHSAAILMCKKVSLEDKEIKDLCENIISSQQSEIDQMKQILERINKNE